MKLTKQQTIEGHRKMWNWIADEIEKRRRTVCIVELKMEYCKNNHLELRKWCFCCEYNEGERRLFTMSFRLGCNEAMLY